MAPGLPAVNAVAPHDSARTPASLDDFFRLRRLHENETFLITRSGLNVIAPGAGLLREGQSGRGLTYGLLAAGCLAGALSASDTPTGQSVRGNLLMVYQNLGFLSA
jgi:hypothetical protein